MPSINLIASRREEKRRLELRIRRLIWTIVSELGVIVLAASLLTVKIVTERAQISQLNGQIGLLHGKVSAIQQLEQETAELQPKVALLNQARNTTLYWYTAMQTIVASLPNETWLTTLSTSGDPATGANPTSASSGSSPAPAGAPQGPIPSLKFDGMAMDSDQVGMAMLKMNQFSNISTVTLNSVSQGSFGAAKAMTFSMAVQLKPNTAASAPTPLPELQSESSDGTTPTASPVAPSLAAPAVRQASAAQAGGAKESTHA